MAKTTSSLFQIPEKRPGPCGSSVTAFCDVPNSDDSSHRHVRRVHHENTYHLEPPVKFRLDLVQPILDRVLAANLHDRKYDPLECSVLAKSLAQDIRVKVKELGFKRYKIVSHVTIGEKKEQTVRMGSRFLWDTERDNYASASFENIHLFATATVFGIYFE
ncbi:dynein light chain Tctex-type 5-like isoform X2 [Liolophura sinensis]